jgi:hypothetical protein
MKTLNEQFKSCCEPNQSKIIFEENNVYKIKNFFKNPVEAKKFILSLPKWDCDDLDNNTKPGMETFLPTWANDYLTQETFNLNKIYPVYKTDAIVNMHYYGMRKKRNLFQSSNGVFDLPHHDYISGEDNLDCFVLLINLNKYEIMTNFWKFNNKELMVSSEYNNFAQKFQKDNEKEKLQSLKIPKELNLFYQAKYNFNEAIIYNAALLHNANVIESYTKENPRITLRYMYYLKHKKLINTIKYN